MQSRGRGGWGPFGEGLAPRRPPQETGRLRGLRRCLARPGPPRPPAARGRGRAAPARQPASGAHWRDADTWHHGHVVTAERAVASTWGVGERDNTRAVRQGARGRSHAGDSGARVARTWLTWVPGIARACRAANLGPHALRLTGSPRHAHVVTGNHGITRTSVTGKPGITHPRVTPGPPGASTGSREARGARTAGWQNPGHQGARNTRTWEPRGPGHAHLAEGGPRHERLGGREPGSRVLG